MNTDTSVIIRKRLQCEKCGETFSNSFERCPKCGSHQFVGYSVVNPISRLPIEAILRLVGHIVWMLGVVTCIAFLWNTNTPDTDENILLMLAGGGILMFSIVLSVALFGLGEALKRIIRIQRRVKAMFEDQQSQGGA